MEEKQKLIEVALPLEVINRESAREKSIRRGHPSTMHLWWARRPLAAARAVLFAQLVDDPSAHPEDFPTEELQRKERDRLHKIIERLVVWENISDESLLREARAEISRSAEGALPVVLDPFAGGGSIPLEAQRLGLVAHASDLNPVAVLINKAQIEYPPRFWDRSPVFPGLAGSQTTDWLHTTGLAADVREYGNWVAQEAEKRIGNLYPPIHIGTGTPAPVIAWLWARTVQCPNPACGLNAPLVRSWWLFNKKGQEAYAVPHLPVDGSKDFSFTIGNDPGGPAVGPTMSGRTGGSCVACQTAIEKDYVKSEASQGRMGQVLMSIVAQGGRKRVYLAPDDEQRSAAIVEVPSDVPDQELGYDPRNLWTPAYGLSRFCDLFTDRQLVALTTLSDLVIEVRHKVFGDAVAAGMSRGERLEAGGSGAEAYADAVAIYLALVQSKLTNLASSITTWMSDRGAFRETFARQALPMAWDFAESNPLGDVGGGWRTTLEKCAQVIEMLPHGSAGQVVQADATAVSFGHSLISTDPPYYDNIVYSDLSDFFYVWLRRSLRKEIPALFQTMQVPKTDELVANPYRHAGPAAAKDFFEHGFKSIFENARRTANPSYPATVYYAFKQSDSDGEGDASSGWETILQGMIESGWRITATWPMRTEGPGRILARGSNALASSIVLCLRPRTESAPTQDRRGFVDAMRAELGAALQKLQAGGIAPVDLPQAAIGPGMAVFSRYSRVLESDGSQMKVRSALARINEVLDEVLSEQEGDFDPTTRFAIAWFRTHGYNDGKFGSADDLARARNTAVATLERSGILTGRRGVVRLYRPSDLNDEYDVISDESVSTWEALHHLIRIMESEGAPAAGAFLAQAATRADGAIDVDLVPELSHLLFRIAEDNKWTKDAISFNSLVTAWPDIVDASRAPRSGAQQEALDFRADD